jgi:hypothetical protein
LNSSILPYDDSNRQQIVIYRPDADHEMAFRIDNDETYGSQREIATMFDLTIRSVQQHVQNFKRDDPYAYEKGVKEFDIPTAGGYQPVVHYNLDIITYIGYRAQATPQTVAFRRWVGSLVKREVDTAPKSEFQILEQMFAVFSQQQRQIAEVIEQQANQAQQIEAVVNRLDDADYYTILQWCTKQRIKSTHSIRSMWGRAATALSSERGIEIKGEKEGLYYVGRYHKSVLQSVCVPKQKPSNQLPLSNTGS